jgi:hypothetical protein
MSPTLIESGAKLMKFLWPLILFPLVLNCSTDAVRKKPTSLAKGTKEISSVANAVVPPEIRYHCSESASGISAVLYMGLFNPKNGTAISPAVRISGMIPIFECRSRSRNYYRDVQQIPGNNYYCEIDAGGTAMLFEQALSVTGNVTTVPVKSMSGSNKQALAVRKISKAMTRRQCTGAARVKQAASGKLWQES